MAFVAESIVAYKQSATHRLCPKEYVDVYQVEMQKLSVSFGGMIEQGRIMSSNFFEPHLVWITWVLARY